MKPPFLFKTEYLFLSLAISRAVNEQLAIETANFFSKD